MNLEGSAGSIIFFIISLGLLTIAFYLWRAASRFHRKFHRLLSSLPGYEEGQDLDTCLKQCFDQSKTMRDRCQNLRGGFLDLAEQISLAAALYEPETGTILYNHAFAQLTGIRNRDNSSMHALELPLFGDLFRDPPQEKRLVELGNLKLIVHFRSGPDLVMAVFEDLAQKEQEEAERQYFSNSLWHEIKTPVTVMKGFINILLEELRDSFLLKATSIIDKQIARIETLIGNLRTLAGHRENSETLCQARDVTDILHRLVETWQDEVLKRNLVMNFDQGELAEADFTLRFTRGDFFVLASNLISNAVKFSREGGEVRIHPSLAQNSLSLEVSDTGPGVPPQLQAILYSPLGYEFLEGEGSRGMGLFLVKEAVERGQGRIVFKSEEKGTSYRIILPFQDD